MVQIKSTLIYGKNSNVIPYSQLEKNTLTGVFLELISSSVSENYPPSLTRLSERHLNLSLEAPRNTLIIEKQS